jgi:EAL domain-containing protein (putative c-di-GMP-specific phosphodiesterase class I)
MSAVARAWPDEQTGVVERQDADGKELSSGSHEIAHVVRRSRIECAMEPGAMNIVFQPVVDLRRGTIAGAEALARFALEPIRTPDLWFGEAWEVGLGVELEILAIRRALASLPLLPDGAHLAINASPATLVSSKLDELLDEVPGPRLTVELTEHAQVEDYANVKDAIDRLRRRGIRLAIDDAGAGFSSLQHILHLRPNLIKLDRSLTQGIDGDPVRYALAAALVTFATSLEAEVCAEGIEKDSELAALQHLGIAYGQGYFLGRPLPLPLTPPPRGVWLSERASSAPRERAVRGSMPAAAVVRAQLSDLPRVAPAVTEPPATVASERHQAPVAPDAKMEAVLDRFTRWATILLGAPIARYSVLANNRELVRSAAGEPLIGKDGRTSTASWSPCHEVLATNTILAVEDAAFDAVCRRHGLSATPDAFPALSYLGVPVRTASGRVLGVLAVMDRRPRAWTSSDEATLCEVATALVNEFEVRAIRRASLDVPGLDAPERP